MAIETRVDHLETWAGPGQAEALSISLSALRQEFADFRKETRTGLSAVRADFRRELGTVKTDLADFRRELGTVRTDLAEVKGHLVRIDDTLAEVLRRLPPAPPAG